MRWLKSVILVYIIGVHSSMGDYVIKCQPESDNGNRDANCVAEGVGDEPLLNQGDVIVDPDDDDDSARNAIINTRFRWPNGIIPFVFHNSFQKNEAMAVMEAMKYIMNRTCVKFKHYNRESPFLLITKRDKCFANIGAVPFAGNAFVQLNLQSPECFHSGTIQHEILHVLGLFHEQSRPDRDNYVEIHWSNIPKKEKHNFDAYKPHEITTYGVPYDYKSVMHYEKHAFAINKNLPTITAKGDPNLKLGQYVAATDGDLEKVRRMYNCP